jgi:hypothetical protein
VCWPLFVTGLLVCEFARIAGKSRFCALIAGRCGSIGSRSISSDARHSAGGARAVIRGEVAAREPETETSRGAALLKDFVKVGRPVIRVGIPCPTSAN